jgi:hypothetical protein
LSHQEKPCWPHIPYLAATVSPCLHQWCGGAQFDGLWLMEDDCWERFLFQCEDIQFRLQHGLKVLKIKKKKEPAIVKSFGLVYGATVHQT